MAEGRRSCVSQFARPLRRRPACTQTALSPNKGNTLACSRNDLRGPARKLR